MAQTIKDLTDERIVEKLQEWHDNIKILEHRTVNIMFNADYKKACNNYNRYLREWARRGLDEKSNSRSKSS